jgi:hypothetical protein
MIPGPDYIYKCPKCAALLTVGSLTSGNTFGSVLFSDGKEVAPMLPDFPNLTKCNQCNTILWLSEMKEIATCDIWEEEFKPEWENADRADFLDIADLFRALELDSVKKSKKKEVYVRRQIWWTFNDRVRENKEIFSHEQDEVLWKQNCQRLIKLFNTADINQKIMTAELYRNLGEFDVCMELINSLNKKFDWVVKKFRNACKNKNRFLIKLR